MIMIIMQIIIIIILIMMMMVSGENLVPEPASQVETSEGRGGPRWKVIVIIVIVFLNIYIIIIISVMMLITILTLSIINLSSGLDNKINNKITIIFRAGQGAKIVVPIPVHVNRFVVRPSSKSGMK